MSELIDFIVGALKITLLDLTLCGDNIGVIALATKNLPEQFAKKAGLIGIGGAISLRILFASMMTLIFSMQTFPIKLLGGLLLVKITWDFVKPKEEEHEDVKTANRFWEAVAIIIVADISMSLDNVLAIAGAADGNVLLIVLGIALNIPILFFGSRFVVNLMNKYAIVIYIGGAVLAHTSFKMIFEDNLIAPYFAHWFKIGLPWVMALLTLGYGAYLIHVKKLYKKEQWDPAKNIAKDVAIAENIMRDIEAEDGDKR